MKLSTGQKAPSFTLYNTFKQPLSLDSLQGQKVLLLFFPAAFTSTCTKELCSTNDNLAWYNTMNCKVIGISTDSVYTLIRYKEEYKLNFDLIADYNKEICGLYGAQYNEFNFGMKGTAKRAAFAIDEKGIIKYAEVLDNSGELPNFENIKKALA